MYVNNNVIIIEYVISKVETLQTLCVNVYLKKYSKKVLRNKLKPLFC